MDEDTVRCYELLDATSRSFAPVVACIEREEVRDAICVFYLVLRALDTVEDDTSVEKAVRMAELVVFHERLSHPEVAGVGLMRFGAGDAGYSWLMRDFGVVVRRFRALPERIRAVIERTVLEMGRDMAAFLDAPVVTWADYDRYCWAVAGSLMEPVDRVFRVERVDRVDHYHSVNSGGLLQRVNIIRDLHDDLTEGRCYWPVEVYPSDATSLIDPCHREEAMKALRAMILELLTFLGGVNLIPSDDQDERRFKAQLVGVATLHLPLLYGNPDVFTPARVAVSRAQFVERMEGHANVAAFVMSDLRALAAKATAAGDAETVDLVAEIIAEAIVTRSF